MGQRRGIPTGSYTLIVQKPGFEETQLRVRIGPGPAAAQEIVLFIVEEVVAGPLEVGDSLPFEWHARFDSDIACPLPYRRESIQGLLGIWFLERVQNGPLRLMGEFWNLENPQSLEYHASELKALDPRTERASLLLDIVEKQTLRVKGLQ